MLTLYITEVLWWPYRAGGCCSGGWPPAGSGGVSGRYWRLRPTLSGAHVHMAGADNGAIDRECVNDIIVQSFNSNTGTHVVRSLQQIP